jgi:hypothetical protein
MSELDDALVVLEQAVARLEAAPVLADREAAAKMATEREAEAHQVETTAAEIVQRVEAALAKISQVLDREG